MMGKNIAVHQLKNSASGGDFSTCDFYCYQKIVGCGFIFCEARRMGLELFASGECLRHSAQIPMFVARIYYLIRDLSSRLALQSVLVRSSDRFCGYSTHSPFLCFRKITGFFAHPHNPIFSSSHSNASAFSDTHIPFP